MRGPAILALLVVGALGASFLSVSRLRGQSGPPDPPLEAPYPSDCDPARIDREMPQRQLPFSDRLVEVLRRTTPVLREALEAQGLCLGSPIYVRVFKEEKRLELWVRQKQEYVLFREYPICTFSGELGPKRREGDYQAPEGFYRVGPGQMNPNSGYHLAFNLGYPNAYERAKGWTGSALMVHGRCVSIGCFAMTDPVIEEIYTLAHHALRHTQNAFPVHVFPFELTDAKLARYEASEWKSFWLELKPGYDRFERKRVPPDVRVADGRYAVLE